VNLFWKCFTVAVIIGVLFVAVACLGELITG